LYKSVNFNGKNVYLLSDKSINEKHTYKLLKNATIIKGKMLDADITNRSDSEYSDYLLPWLEEYRTHKKNISFNQTNNQTILFKKSATIDFILEKQPGNTLHARTSNLDLILEIAVETGLNNLDYSFSFLDHKEISIYYQKDTDKAIGFSFYKTLKKKINGENKTIKYPDTPTKTKEKEFREIIKILV